MKKKHMTLPDEWQTDFAEALAQLEKTGNRATLAQLRRGRGKAFGQEPRRDGWVLSQLRRLGRANFTDEWEVNRCCLVASLFAEHSASRGYGTLGAAFRRMANQPGASEESIERRFHALLDSDREDLPERLRYAVSLLKSKEVAVNWAQLLADVTNWGWPSRSVQKAWSRDFWAPRKSSATNDSDETPATDVSDVAAAAGG
jgi:CRISPR system Cascade subunit CasB